MGKFKIKHIPKILVETAKKWMAADPFRESAVISYYAIFSIPGLLIIIIWAAGVFFGEELVRGEINNQITAIVGGEAAASVEEIVQESEVENTAWFMKIVGVVALLIGATTLFFQLQKSLNYLWDVEADPDNNLKKLLVDRASSLGLILIIAFLLLISLILSSIIANVSNFITRNFGEGMYVLIEAVNFILSVGIVTLLFAMMYKFLPDVDIKWKSVWVGALVTSLLFSIGKTLLGLYFGIADPGSSFGAAGTIILIMLWVNYTCLILFFGAEFTKVFAQHYGHPIQPSKHAKWRLGHDPEMNEQVEPAGS
ncbi:MAG TPA: YihY/virulence factor BrkB family protein [Cyclobacteriaceae bacterium]|nr:YihY/virulence factor BrkB family protein [Cyclobacteriaceae bacterium]